MYIHVILPSDAHAGSNQKRAALQDVAKVFGIEVHFPQYSATSPSFDLETTLAEIGRAAFVVADLSCERPSCYYELGLAEAIGKYVCLLAENGTHIHQTASRNSVVFYADIEEFKVGLTALIKNYDEQTATNS